MAAIQTERPAPPPASLRERLQAWVNHLEHVLPAQAPIRDFVHHNTLHGLQHLPFSEALAEANRLSGAHPWMSEARCRQLFAGGRITAADLDAAFDEVGEALGKTFAPDDLDAPLTGLADLPAIRPRTLLQLGFAHDLRPVGKTRSDWLLAEGGALARFAAGIGDDAKARLLAGGAAGQVLPALWQACAEVLDDAPAAAVGNELTAVFEGFFDAPATAADWQAEARALWPALVARIGREWTLSTLLERLTGENVLDEVRPMLIRHLAAHLDQGLSGWHNPARGAGFYAAWRASAGADLGWDLDEQLAAREEIAALPADPLDTIARELMHLGPDEAHWGDYLERLALELPGWSGMFLWRDRHAGQAEAGAVPVTMADYLAVRLVLERICCEELVRRIWGLPLFLSELGDHFLVHPAELWVRHACHAGLLPEALADEARALIAGPAGDADWQALATTIGSLPADPAASDPEARGAVGDRRWPLFLIAQHLGLDAGALRAAGRAGAEALLAAAGGLDANQRGYLWLLAYERRYRETIFAALAANAGRPQTRPTRARPAAQLVFCMDDREEGTRRHLEEVNPALETFGAAGFFGVPMFWRGIDDETRSALCPVVVTPENAVGEIAAAVDAAAEHTHAARRALRRRAQDALHRLTRDGVLAALPATWLAAPLTLLAMLLRTVAPAAFGERLQRWQRAFERPLPTRVDINAEPTDADKGGLPRQGFTDAEQAARVEAFLRSIGLVGNFAPLVVLVGHGSNSVNNPHRAAYDCGACSGRHGGPNARVFAAMANRPVIRAALAGHGIAIPDDTWFLGAEHDTCDEQVTWYDLDLLPAPQHAAQRALVEDLDEAGRRHAVERCRRYASAPARPAPATALRHLAARRHDWSQARPELGHATVAAAFIGRRRMSRGAFFDRRVFLISYDPEIDADGRQLEAILLAAGPVGAGIALEYYFSSVDNSRFGCGSKVTHNLAGLFGVMEGVSSDLRTGLPRQMIEIHEPMRLLVVLEQTPAVVAAIYQRQPLLQELIGGGWIVLATCAPGSAEIHRFDPVRGWVRWQNPGLPVAEASCSAAWLGAHREPLPPALLTGREGTAAETMATMARAVAA